MNKEYPILRCEIITEDKETAKDLMRMMGHSEEVEFKETKTIPHYLTYQLN